MSRRQSARWPPYGTVLIHTSSTRSPPEVCCAMLCGVVMLCTTTPSNRLETFRFNQSPLLGIRMTICTVGSCFNSCVCSVQVKQFWWNNFDMRLYMRGSCVLQSLSEVCAVVRTSHAITNSKLVCPPDCFSQPVFDAFDEPCKG